MMVKRAIIGTLIAASVVAVPLQMIIDPSTINAASALIVCVSSLMTLLYIACSRAVDEQPLSTFALLGFSVTTQMGALFVQTLSWIPLKESLYDPIGTFATLAGYLAVAIVTHAAYRYFTAPNITKEGTIRHLLKAAGIYDTPSTGVLWCMGMAGVAGLVLAHLDNILGRIGTAFTFFAWAPFLIPLFFREVGATYGNARRNRIMIGAFALLIALVGLLFNMRGIMFTGIVTIGLLYLLAGLRSEAPVTGKAVAWAAVGVAFAVMISGPLADLATSMVIARQWRGKVSGSEMLSTTFRVYNQPSLIAAYRAEQAATARYKAYDEHYIDNPLLARFVNTKYDDNSLHFAAGIKSEGAKQDLRDITVKYLWGILPAPVLSVLGINVDKDQLAGNSMSDYIAYLSRGIPLAGTHRMGSLFGHGSALLGPLFPFVYALICLGMYAVMDLLTIRHAGSASTLSALGMLLTWSFFVGGLTQEALHVVVLFFFRSFLQMVLLYFVVLTTIRIAASFLMPVSSSGSSIQRAQ